MTSKATTAYIRELVRKSSEEKRENEARQQRDKARAEMFPELVHMLALSANCVLDPATQRAAHDLLAKARELE